MGDYDERVPLSWPWIVVPAALGVGAVAGVLLLSATQGRGEKQAVSNAWWRYSRCLIGDTPLAPGETLASRLARIELASESDATAVGWPARCDAIGQEVSRSVHALAEADERYKALTVGVDYAFPLDDIKTGVLEGLFDDMIAAHLPPPSVKVGGNDPPLPPKPRETLPLDSLSIVAYGDSYLATTDPFPGAPVRLLWKTWPRRYCRIDPPLEVARCRDLSPAVRGDAVYLSQMDDAAIEPLVRVVGAGFESKVVRGFSGELVGDDRSMSDHAFGDQVWSSETEGGKTKVLVRPLADDKAKPTLMATLEGGEQVAFDACRTSETAAVVAGTTSTAHVFFRTAGGWSTAVSGAWTWHQTQAIDCRGREVTLTALADHVVSQLRCTEKGCERTDSAKLTTEAYSRDMSITESALADVDGKVLLLGTGDHPAKMVPYIGSLRFRIAPVKDIATAPDVYLLGADDDTNGIGWDHVQVFARGTAALVVIRGNGDRFYLARIDATGAFGPVRLERQ